MNNTADNKSNETVIVALSGGVDSAVAALLLKQQGYRAHAVFMQNWEADQDDPYCTIPEDLQDARSVCEQLNIPLTTANFAREYWDNVFQHCLDEYNAGRTPNPDILCNREIKFKAFLKHALALGGNCIATGHYVRKDKKNSKYRLLRGIDKNKDQSYFLYTLTQDQLARSLFPIGNLQKSEVREIAKNSGLANSNKKDSTGICFIGERKFASFLKEYLLIQPGDIVTENGKIVGKHDGLMFYTLGQRKGLGIGGIKGQQEKPWYIIKKDIIKNRLVVEQQHNHPLLLSKQLQYKNTHWTSGVEPQFPFACTAQVRYRQEEQKCVVTKTNVKFEAAQWAITPGQSVVFYQGDVCLGGAEIL